VPPDVNLKVYRTDAAASAVQARPSAVLVLGHGAGAGQTSPFMTMIARGLARRALVVATFDFPYVVLKRKVPDAAPVLEAAWRRAIERVQVEPDLSVLPMFIGGKSLGGRIASHVAAAGLSPAPAGLIFLGYPLHPPNAPEKRRDAHLPSIQAPMLFIQGERDTFGTADEIAALLPRLHANATLHAIRRGDHSFKVPARGEQSQDDVFEEVLQTIVTWTTNVL
jgi:predicted alpha/beta-hydrolase family hydrolase